MHHGIWKSTHQLIMLHKSGKTRNTIVLSHLQPVKNQDPNCMFDSCGEDSRFITHYPLQAWFLASKLNIG